MDIDTLAKCGDMVIKLTDGKPLDNYKVVNTLSEEDQRRYWTGFAFHTALNIFDQFSEDRYSVQSIPKYLYEIDREYKSDNDLETFKANTFKLQRALIDNAIKDCPCCNYEPREYYCRALDILSENA